MYAFRHTALSIPCEHVWLDSMLAHAPGLKGVVVLVQNGCIMHSDLREVMVARRLQEAGFATLSADLLTRQEEQRDPDARYNIPLMAHRLLAIVEWLDHQPGLGSLPLGLSASGTPAGAAVRACARQRERVAALVSRAGRPDLAGAGPLGLVACPTRLIVGGADPGLASYQRPAYEHLIVERDWQEVAGADEDFRSPGALEQAARLSVEWMERHLPVHRVIGDPQGASIDTHKDV